MVRKGRKPRLRPFSYKVLCEIGRYIARHDLKGRDMASAGPDVLDGWVVRCEVEELVKKGWLRVVGKPRDDDALCGEMFTSSWTAVLTQRAIETFWPQRA